MNCGDSLQQQVFVLVRFHGESLLAPLLPAAPGQHKQNAATPFPSAPPTRMPPFPDAPPLREQAKEWALPFINEDIKAENRHDLEGRRSPAEEEGA